MPIMSNYQPTQIVKLYLPLLTSASCMTRVRDEQYDYWLAKHQ